MRRAVRLCDALAIRRGEVAAFVGGGGKTSAILRLADELRREGRRVLVTTTTKVGAAIPGAVPSVDGSRPDLMRRLRETLDDEGRVFLHTGRGPSGKYSGIGPEELGSVLAELPVDAALVEADGSRQRPLKLPAQHEPALPRTATLVVPVAGLDVLGRPVDEENVHRAELAEALGAAPRATPEFVGRVLGSPLAGRKNVPDGAQVVPVLNKLDLISVRNDELARLVDAVMRSGGFERTVISSVREGLFLGAETSRVGVGT